jgi:hypothetical protein
VALALVVNVACAHVPAISPLAFAAAIREDSLSSVDARIFQVVSGGSWSDATGNGHYRVVVSSFLRRTAVRFSWARRVISESADA